MKFKTPADCAAFINSSSTRAYKVEVWMFIRKNYQDKFVADVKRLIKKEKRV